jgi:drug/metabolite transporter (DMT)-like permease
MSMGKAGGLPLLYRAAAITAASAFCMNLEVVLIRFMGEAVPVAMILFVRAGAQLAWVSPDIIRHGRLAFRTTRPVLHLVRGLLSLFSWIAYYYAYRHLPLATATVLSFTSVMWTVALAGPLLRERVGWRRWSATLAGFLGVLLVVRPGAAPLGWPIAAALFSALCGAGIVITTKRLTATESTRAIMLYVGVITFVGTIPMVLPVWVWPNLHDALLLGGMAVLGTGAFWLWITALRLADASFVAPITYVRLVFAVAAGLLLFGEGFGAFTAAGAALIVGSAIYITRREAALARRRAGG